MPKFNCPHCTQSIDAPEELAGTEAECPTCGGAITVPKQVLTEERNSPPPLPPKKKKLPPLSEQQKTNLKEQQAMAAVIVNEAKKLETQRRELDIAKAELEELTRRVNIEAIEHEVKPEMYTNSSGTLTSPQTSPPSIPNPIEENATDDDDLKPPSYYILFGLAQAFIAWKNWDADGWLLYWCARILALGAIFNAVKFIQTFDKFFDDKK